MPFDQHDKSMKIPKGEVMSSPPYLLTDFLSFPIFPDQKDTFGDYVCVCVVLGIQTSFTHTWQAIPRLFFFTEKILFFDQTLFLALSSEVT